MWCRHRPDILSADIAYALRTLLGRADAPDEDHAIVRGWFPEQEAVVCLSVRSGFDLILQSLAISEGDEILFSEVTIAGMVRVAEAAGAVARGVPVECSTLAPTPRAVAERITERTRAIVLAPLFGSQNSLATLAKLARDRGILVIEDAAQAFKGRVFAGSEEADITMFSFGAIKRATAGGGAVLRVRDPALRGAMLERLNSYPTQSRWDYARRLATLATLRATSHHRLYGVVFRLLSLAGDPDRLVSSMGKTRASQQSLSRLRRRPCSALKRVVARRVQQHQELSPMTPADTLNALGSALCGAEAGTLPGWVLPVMVDDPARVARDLHRLGYDASKLSSLIRVDPNKQACLVDDSAANEPPKEQNARHWLKSTIFLPTDPAMPQQERRRMVEAALS